MHTHKKLDVLWNGHLARFFISQGGQDAHPTINLMWCGTGILPVFLVREGGLCICSRGFNRPVSAANFMDFNH
ncbi:hypothetical protein QUA54_24210 [Microcoleus sp. MOSTC5]